MDSEIIFIAVTSEGFIGIFKKILENITKDCVFFGTYKRIWRI